MNRAGLMAAVRTILDSVGEDPDREGLKGTPDRVARSYEELLSGYARDPLEVLKVDFAAGGYDEMIVCREIDFFSLCEHHMLPFYGTATVGYIPGNGRVVGLSKLARLVELYARRLQIQERMTEQITCALWDALEPRGVGVVVRASHFCMISRGVNKQRAEMVTSRLMGAMRDHADARSEFLSIAGM